MGKKSLTVPGEKELRNAKHELFSYLYAGLSSKTYFGKAAPCYAHAYGYEEKINDLDADIDRTYDMVGKQGENRRRELKTSKRKIQNICRVEAHRLLTNPNVSQRIDYLLDRFLSDAMADREMAYVMAQRDDLMSKVSAYREIAKVKSRIRGNDALSGEFVFTWDEEQMPKSPARKGPKSVKATVKVASSSEAGEGDLAEFS